MRKLLALSTLSLCALSVCSYADSGPYAEFEFGYFSPPSDALLPTSSNPLLPLAFVLSDFGPKINVGYQFNTFFGLQAGYFLVADNQGNNDDSVEPNFHSRLEYIDLVARGTLPVLPWFDVVGLAGGAYAHQSISGSTSPPRDGSNDRVVPELGVGLQFNLLPGLSMSLNAQYFGPSGPITEMWYIPVGIRYQF